MVVYYQAPEQQVSPEKELYRIVVVYFLPTLLVNTRTAGAYTQENSGGSGCPDGEGNA
jgi:hypothetical protein